MSSSKYKEDIELVSLSKTQTLLGKNNWQSYSGKIIQNPRNYLMDTSAWLEKILNSIPLKLLNTLTVIPP